MDNIYLSPHLDDATLSCGGLIWQQAQEGGKPQIWTICAGDSPLQHLSSFAHSLHKRWNVGLDAVSKRREEDKISSEILNATPVHLNIPDSIYRIHPDTNQPLYVAEQDIFGSLHPADINLIDKLAHQLTLALTPQSRLICPLSLGNHVDHQLTRKLAEIVRVPLYFYADYPYILDHTEQILDLIPKNYQAVIYPLSDQALSAWKDSIAAHQSQISTFWEDLDDMRQQIDLYFQSNQGIKLWMPQS